MAKFVLIGGGTGFIGRPLCAALQNHGYKVMTVTRNKKRKEDITWDDIKRNGLPPGISAVINLAGELVLNPLRRWSKDLEEDIWKSRIDTTKLLRNAIVHCESPPKVWTTMSGVGFYPPHATEVYNEFSVPEARDYWSRLSAAWEEAGDLPEDADVRRCIVRSGVVLGKDGGAIQQMMMPFWLGLGGPIGSGTQFFPWIHIKDIVGIFLHTITNDHVTGVLNGVAPDVKTNKEFATCFASALSRPSIIPLPHFAVTAIFGPIRASMLLEGQNVQPARTLECGYSFEFPKLAEAMHDIVK